MYTRRYLFLMVLDIQLSMGFTFYTKIDLKQNQFKISKTIYYERKIENNSVI